MRAPIVRHSTITDNVADSDKNGTGNGGGLWVPNGYGGTQFDNSIIAANTDHSGIEHDVYGSARFRYSILGRDNPLFENFHQFLEGNLLGTNSSPVNPMLEPLADNGGQTLTHALLPGSPAINAGDPAAVAGSGQTPLYDQRGMGFPRIVGGRVDIGAFESAPSSSAPVFTSPDAVNVPENSTAVMTVTATDADLPPQTITFSIIGGLDAAKFNLTSGGALTFVSAPTFEAPTDANGDNIYVVTVEADDGAGGTTAQTIQMTVTPVNEFAPVFTSPSAVNVPQNTTFVVQLATIDADLPPQTPIF